MLLCFIYARRVAKFQRGLGSIERDGEVFDREEFVAKKIGHDLARTNYDVDRTRRSPAAAERDVPRLDKVALAESGHTRATSDTLAI